MGLDGSPKKFATDVAKGLFHINRSTLKRYSLPEIRKIMSGLQEVAKDIRREVVESGDYEALKSKGMRGQRVQGAMRAIQAYFKEKRMKL